MLACRFGRLIIFEAFAVNAGSTLSPVGNPQNLFLWQSSGAGFLEFTATMLPLALVLTGLLLALVPLAFPARRIEVSAGSYFPAFQRPMLWLSLLLYPIFLLMVEQGLVSLAALAVIGLFLLLWPRSLLGVDWLLLLVFLLMFLVLGQLALLPPVAALAGGITEWPGGMLSGGILLSQLISNVPAAIFLEGFTDDWRFLAWGVSVGGFGLAIGSMANLIALRLARLPGLWWQFHLWSLPVLLLAMLLSYPLAWWWLGA